MNGPDDPLDVPDWLYSHNRPRPAWSKQPDPAATPIPEGTAAMSDLSTIRASVQEVNLTRIPAAEEMTESAGQVVSDSLQIIVSAAGDEMPESLEGAVETLTACLATLQDAVQGLRAAAEQLGEWHANSQR